VIGLNPNTALNGFSLLAILRGLFFDLIRTINQSINQSINQLINQSINQSINETNNQKM